MFPCSCNIIAHEKIFSLNDKSLINSYMSYYRIKATQRTDLRMSYMKAHYRWSLCSRMRRVLAQESMVQASHDNEA